ncbi:unnamed protein product [Meloidogyne enterolobii]|uniref:Uncharacterized protein n=1 Tax=Meloidogyne enterolobii TaxID=390850 RepID=A0ACB0ZCU2_MELEN
MIDLLDLEFKTYLYSLSILSEINPIKVVEIEAGLRISKLFEIGLKDIGLKDQTEKDDDIKSEESKTKVEESGTSEEKQEKKVVVLNDLVTHTNVLRPFFKRSGKF